jgi:hypothetical protein
MDSQVYRYKFDESLDIAEVEATANLAVLTTESLHGESRVRLETRHRFDAHTRSCVIDATGEVSVDLNRIFLGLISREFGASSFRVERIDAFDVVPATADA